MTEATDAIRRQLDGLRAHVTAGVDGLDDDAMQRAPLPSGWTMAQLLVHLAFDDEMFWVSGVLGGDPRAAEAVAAGQDGWKLGVGVSGPEAIRLYTEEIERSQKVLEQLDFSAPLAWWPEDLFGGWRPDDATQVLLHLVTETAVHAGHLDAARELIDGRQHLVLD